jgi:hypothetical protein
LSALIDLEGVLSSGRLHQRTSLGASCLEFAGSDGIRSCATMFFQTDWFQRKRCEALLYVAIMGHALRSMSMVKSETENDMEAEFLRTSNGDSSLCGVEEFAWRFMTSSSGFGKWG